MTKLDCTRKVQELRFNNTDEEVCKIIGISKPTLYTRLKENNWKVLEIFKIERL